MPIINNLPCGGEFTLPDDFIPALINTNTSSAPLFTINIPFRDGVRDINGGTIYIRMSSSPPSSSSPATIDMYFLKSISGSPDDISFIKGHKYRISFYANGTTYKVIKINDITSTTTEIYSNNKITANSLTLLSDIVVSD